jgi:UDP-glucose 4-epimerase
MNILIIGSEGFIGNHCVNYFLNKGYKVYGCDLLDYKSLSYTYTKISRLNPNFDTLFDNVKYDFCINAAGNGSVPVSIEKPLLDFDANCYDVIRLLQLIKDRCPKCKYIQISSAAVYGNPQSLPIQESDQLSPLSPYGWHKLIAEKLCEEYSTLHNLSIAVVRPFSVFGPKLRKQLLWDMYQKAIANPEIELWGDGTESRDFIFINDLVYAIDLILEKDSSTFNIYNLASGEEVTIETLAKLFFKELGGNIKYKFNGQTRAGDPRNWKASIEKLATLGFVPGHSLEDGLKTTALWLKTLN